MDRMEMALLNALGKTRKMYETVNLEELVEKAGLLGLQPPEARVVPPLLLALASPNCCADMA